VKRTQGDDVRRAAADQIQELREVLEVADKALR
jgi:hypothetical protein